MKTVRIDFTTQTDFRAVCNREIWARVSTPKWYSFNALIKLDEDSYGFRLVRSLSSYWELTENDRSLYEVYAVRENGLRFVENDIVKYKVHVMSGWLKRNIVFSDNNDCILFNIQTEFSWKEFETIYTVYCHDSFGNTSLERAIIMACVRYYKTTANNSDDD